MTKFNPLFLILLGTAILVSTCTTNEQEKIEKVTLVQNFKLYYHYLYEVQRWKTDSGKSITENFKTATEVAFCVLDQKDGIRQCSWKYGAAKVIGVSPDDVEIGTQKLINAHYGIEIKFNIDTNGTILGITNFEQCKKQLQKSITRLYDYSTDYENRKQYSRLIDELGFGFNSPELFLSTFYPEFYTFFAMFGETIKCDSVYVRKSKLLDAIPGESVSSISTTKIEQIKYNIASVSVNYNIPTNELNTTKKDSSNKLSLPQDRSDTEAKIQNLNTVNTTYQYDIQDKTLREVYFTRRIENNGVTKSQVIDIILMN